MAWAAGGFPEPPGSQPIPTKNPTRKTTQKMFFPKPLPVFMVNILGMFEQLVNQSGFPGFHWVHTPLPGFRGVSSNPDPFARPAPS